MPLAHDLHLRLESGIHRIGEVEILSNLHGHEFVLCHHQDLGSARAEQFGGLDTLHGPDAGREISTWSESGEYRFGKAMTNLRRGWVITLESAEQLRQALDLIYPAAVGLDIAHRRGTLHIEHLRDKLNRQTGMYRFARGISDAGAQALVRSVCGPAHNCARRILWQLDPDTPLDDSEASRYEGIPGGLPENQAIPLLCREACNHFVAECRKAAKAEYEASQAAPSTP
jgi:hypothetical protein